MKDKTVSAEIKYSKKTQSGEVTVTRRAALCFNADTTFSQIQSFLKEFNRVLRGYKHCAKQALFCEVELSVGVYDVGDTVSTLSYDRWRYIGTPEYECEGLYLHPDTRYTNENNDMWIDFSEDVLSQLAEALG